MSNDPGTLYLREDVYFEPLLNQWYAWPYLLPPVTGAQDTWQSALARSAAM